MSYVHVIQINDEKASGSTVSSIRRSETRKYLACVVATTTEETVRHYADNRRASERELAGWEVKLTERCAVHGMTEGQAEEWFKQAKDRWFRSADGYFDTKERLYAESGRRLNGARLNELTKLTKESLKARGFQDPFDPESPYGISEAASKAASARAALQHWSKVPAVGSQAVLSWHTTETLAQKAIGGPSGVRPNGDRLDVRTDIRITESKSRPAAEIEGGKSTRR